MEWTTETDKFAVVRGFIDARDPNSRLVYGAFALVSGYQKTLYFKEIFTNDPIDRTLSWPELLAILNDENREPVENSILAHYKKEFHDFIDLQRLLEYGRNRLDAKEIERKITYFCSDALGLSAITFLDLTMVGEKEMLALLPFLSENFEPTEDNDTETPGDDDDPNGDEIENTDEDEGEKEKNEIFLACEPVLDPISGVAMNNLSLGDRIAARLPETSSIYQFFINQYPAFDGIIEGEIKDLRINEYDTAIVALKLADGISGTLKLSGKVRIKRLTAGKSASSGNAHFSMEIIFAALGMVIFLAAMGVLLYVMD